MNSGRTRELIERWREDEGGTYRRWFLWDDRLKNFRSIRSGIQLVASEIEAGTFGNVYKGSSLEVVVGSIAEQRQMFKGADHAFLWKPKLRIPDIYENRDNQRAFGSFLGTCVCCTSESQVLEAIRRLDAQRVKGLGPAAANLLYFLHPTIASPFNTAIVNGYNALVGARVKLGRWSEYLAIREGILRLNAEHRDLLSNDLGAVAALLFDVGTGRYQAPPLDDGALEAWRADVARVHDSEKARAATEAERDGDRTHSEVQGWLRDLGKALGFDVWIAANDRNRPCGSGRLADGCVSELPATLAAVDAVPLIDVLWLDRRSLRVEAAFEVEHTTSIHSGIMRMVDLALCGHGDVGGLFLVAPDEREGDVRRQLARPAMKAVAGLRVRYLSYGDLSANRDAMARFGHGLRPVEAIARAL
ncbi:MAG TPA: type II restriction endonuclease [Anaeromyxobacteraceae bacterium]|nr:type II restriction endonuclease [Anaeromyxobacteraceae bacterium]